MADNKDTERRQEILTAVKLVGWIPVRERLKTSEDVTIFEGLLKEEVDLAKIKVADKLKEAGIIL